jgi:multisubunit Na+/H+ antiporter MnhB subunit
MLNTEILEVMASEHDGKLWGLHINGFEQVRYERVHVRLILVSFALMYLVLPILLVKISLTSSTQRTINASNVVASLMTGAGFSVVIVAVFGSRLFVTIFSSLVGPGIALGVYSILRQALKEQTNA